MIRSVTSLSPPSTKYTGPDSHEQAASTHPAEDARLEATLGEISIDTGPLLNLIRSLQGLEKHGEMAVASGGTTDIWRGTLNNKQVALKAFRMYLLQDLQQAKTILWKLVPIWKSLTHENVLPFLGIETSIFQLALVYDWCDNGNIVQYLESHPNASRPKLVTVPPVPHAFNVLNDLSSC